MRKRKDIRNNFSAGELAEEYDQVDEELGKQALRSGLNCALINSGGARRRPGSVVKDDVAGESIFVVFDFDDGVEFLVFTNGKVYILDEDGAELDDLVGPWVTADLDVMQVELGADGVDIACQSFWPQVMTRAEDGTWSIADKEFASGIGDGIRQPYFRYAAPGVTLQPSGLTGSITIEFSEDILTADWVDIRVRYLNQEIEIDSIIDAQNANATVIQPLFPTINVTVASGAGFQVGEAVQGSTTEVRGLVTNVVGNVITVVMLEGYDYFDHSATPENLVGPNTSSLITTGSIAATTPAAVTVWDEAMIGAHRGYPGAVTRHRKRLGYANFPKAGSFVAFSAIDRPDDFDVGTGEDNDAFIEGLGDDENAKIRHLASAEQLLVLTDRSCYYVPESEQVPLTPTTVDFKWISDDGASLARPVLSAEGAIFIGESKRLYAVAPTGNVRASWRVLDLSDLGYHLLTDPVELAICSTLGGVDTTVQNRPERYVFIRNSDGTMAVMLYRRASEIVGFVPWVRNGSDIWRSIFVFQQAIYTISRCRGLWQLEQLDPERTMDGEVDYAAAETRYNGQTVHVAVGGHVFGSGLVTAGVNAAGDPGADRTMGADFEVEFEPMPPLSKWIGHEIRRVSAWVYFRRRGSVRVAGVLKSAFRGGDDFGIAPTPRTGSERGTPLGWGEGNSVSVTQPVGEGAPMEIGSYTFEVVS